jgi:hypothetical protein
VARTGQKHIDPLGGMPEHYVGSMSEHLAAAWYLGRGYQVYWPAMQHSFVDFVVEKKRRLQKVQVKTATWSKSGRHAYLQCRTRLTNKSQILTPVEIYDVLVIISEKWVWEIPAELIVSSNLSLGTTRTAGVVSRWDKYRRQLIVMNERTSSLAHATDGGRYERPT